MAGTKAGGIKTAKTIREKYGENFYKTMGRKGGIKSHPETRFFSMNPDIAKIAGAKGGRISKRGKARKHEEVIYDINY